MTSLGVKKLLSEIKLDLGCGIRNRKQPDSEWIHIDIQDIEGIDLVSDFSDMPLPSDWADKIYAGDTIEHIAPYNMDKVLKEWNRVLKTEGVFNGQTPNLHSTMIRYANKELSFQDAFGALYGSNEHEYQHHYQTFTIDTLRELLIQYGFGEIDFSESPCSGGDPRNAHWIVWTCKKKSNV